jgi:hypothetical protein
MSTKNTKQYSISREIIYSIFKTKENYLNYKANFKAYFNDPETRKTLTYSDFFVYSLFRGNDVTKAFTPLKKIDPTSNRKLNDKLVNSITYTSILLSLIESKKLTEKHWLATVLNKDLIVPFIDIESAEIKNIYDILIYNWKIHFNA